MSSPAILMQTDPANGTSSLRVTAGGIAPGQTAKTFTGKVALSGGGATTVSLYTVTTGKTLIITDIYLSTDGAQDIGVQIQAAGTAVFYILCRDSAPCQMPGMDTGPIGTTGQAMTIVFPTSTNSNGFYYVAGVEQ
jgi:hypothetical protein